MLELTLSVKYLMNHLSLMKQSSRIKCTNICFKENICDQLVLLELAEIPVWYQRLVEFVHLQSHRQMLLSETPSLKRSSQHSKSFCAPSHLHLSSIAPLSSTSHLHIYLSHTSFLHNSPHKHTHTPKNLRSNSWTKYSTSKDRGTIQRGMFKPYTCSNTFRRLL